MRLTRITFLLVLFATFACVFPTFAQEATTTPTTKPDTQTYIAENSAAQVSFPADWMLKERSTSDSLISIKLGNSESALEKDLFDRDYVFESGEVHVEVDVVELAQLAQDLPGGSINSNSTPMDIIDVIAKQGMPDEFTFGDPGTTTISGNPAVRMNLTAGKRGEGQLLLIIFNKKWVGGILLYAAAGEGDKWDLIARDIVASIKFNPVVNEAAQTYTSTQGRFIATYPAGWEFDDRSTEDTSGGVFSSTHAAQFKQLDVDEFEAGDVRIEMLVADLAKLQSVSFLAQVDAITSVNDILFLLVSQPIVSNVHFGTVEDTRIFGHPAAQVSLNGSGNGEGRMIVIKRDDGFFVYLLVYHFPGELQAAIDAAYIIANSLVIQPVEPVAESTAEPLALVQTAKTANGLGALSYPEKWFSRQIRDESRYISNSESALKKNFGASFESGQVNILVSVGSTDNYIKSSRLSVASDAAPLEILRVTVNAAGKSIKFGTPVATTVGDNLAARVDFTGKGYEGIAWLIEYQKGALIAVQMLTAPGDAAWWEPTALAIAESIRSTD